MAGGEGESGNGGSDHGSSESNDSLDYVSISTEDLADKENQQAAREDEDKAWSRSEKYYDGRSHGRSQGDRNESWN